MSHLYTKFTVDTAGDYIRDERRSTQHVFVVVIRLKCIPRTTRSIYLCIPYGLDWNATPNKKRKPSLSYLPGQGRCLDFLF